jgi:hypothetical protein
MASRSNQKNDVQPAGDASTEETLGNGSKGSPARLQTESPYQSSDGLNQMRQLGTAKDAAGAPHEVAWTTTTQPAEKGSDVTDKPVTKPTSGPEYIADRLAEMITSTRTESGTGLNILRLTNPQLSDAVEGMGRVLAARPEAEQKATLDMMRQLYQSYDGFKADNDESIAALREAKFNPMNVLGIQRKADEILKMDEVKRGPAVRNTVKQLRSFYLD